MSVFEREFTEFISENGFSFQEGPAGSFLFPKHNVAIVLVHLSDFAGPAKGNWELSVGNCRGFEGWDILYLYEDRWFFRKEFVKKRILARLGVFVSVFARKCRIIKDASIKADSRKNALIRQFLNDNHTYGDARCKYRYALEHEGRIVAVATFSAPRPMPRDAGDGKVILFDSYEWVRYASLPDYRIAGGMGRLLKAFLKDLQVIGQRNIQKDNGRPVEIMTYADLEWSSGDVYGKLGFELVQKREPVEFLVNRQTFERTSLSKISRQESPMAEMLSGNSSDCSFVAVKNLGSAKYLYRQTVWTP